MIIYAHISVYAILSTLTPKNFNLFTKIFYFFNLSFAQQTSNTSISCYLLLSHTVILAILYLIVSMTGLSVPYKKIYAFLCVILLTLLKYESCSILYLHHKKLNLSIFISKLLISSSSVKILRFCSY